MVYALNARRTGDSPFAAVSPTPPGHANGGAGIALAGDEATRWRFAQIAWCSPCSALAPRGESLAAPFRFSEHSNMRHQIKDHNNLDAAVRKAAVDGAAPEFILVRPAMMTEGRQ